MYLRLNYTDRRKIFHTNDINSFGEKDIIIYLKKNNDDLTYDIKFNDKRVSKFSSSDVKFYIEATYRHSFIRFDWGYVKNVNKPNDLTLKNFDPDTVKFNVIFVSEKTNRIVASAYGIKPSKYQIETTLEKEKDDKQKSFINFVPEKMDQLWKMRFPENDEKPEFVFCKDTNFKKILNQSQGLQSAIFPEVFRQTIYHYGVLEIKGLKQKWGDKIIRYAEKLSGQILNENFQDSDQIEYDENFLSWVDSAVDAYTIKFNTKQKFRNNFFKEDE